MHKDTDHQRLKQELSANRCKYCGKPNPRNSTQCLKCYQREYKRRRDRLADQRRKGLCRDCNSVRVDGSMLCCEHKQAAKIRSERLYKRRIANRQCTRCGYYLPEDWSTVSCEKCIRSGRLKTENRRRRVFALYGACCACCGESNFYFLALDHVNNDGAAERKKLKSQTRIFVRIEKGQEDRARYQLLCHNCNGAKAFYGSCPHKWNNPNVRPANAVRVGAKGI